jgi:HPt (histidine-containing phosphotransfer) domain-containing protein
MTAGLDMAALRALGDLVDRNLAAWQELLQAHLDYSAHLVETIICAQTDRDLAALGRAAHTLKSSSALFGANALAKACAATELAALKQLPETVDLSVQVIAEAAKARVELELWRDRVP